LNFKNSGELHLCHDLDVQHLESLHMVESERERGREGERGADLISATSKRKSFGC
jgi:hypothetical protein